MKRKSLSTSRDDANPEVKDGDTENVEESFSDQDMRYIRIVSQESSVLTTATATPQRVKRSQDSSGGTKVVQSVIGCLARDIVDKNLDYILEDYANAFPEYQHIFGAIKSVLDEADVKRHIEDMVRNMFTENDARFCIKNVLDNTLYGIKESEYSLDVNEEEFVHAIVLESIFRQEVSLYVQSIIVKAGKQLGPESRQISIYNRWSMEPSSQISIRRFTIDFASAVNSSEMLACRQERRQSSLKWQKVDIENGTEKESNLKRNRLCSLKVTSESDEEYTESIKKKNVSSNFSCNTNPSDYVSIPPLFTLPFYPQPPFPRCRHAQTSATKKSIKVGITSVSTSDLFLHQMMTQVHAKLTKHYNSTKK